MANITDKLNKIISAIFGKDVRQAIYDGLNLINNETELIGNNQRSLEENQKNLNAKFEEQIKNMSLQDPSSAEIVELRTSISGKTFNIASDRIDDIERRVSWVKDRFKGVSFTAHRGLSKYYPENTLKAYIEADRAGFEGWECDPYISKDGVWFNMHDNTVDRTTDGSGTCESFTWEQLKAMNIDGGNFIQYYKGLKIPTIEAIFKLASSCKNKPVLFLNNRSLTPVDHANSKSLADIIRRYNYEDKTVIFTGLHNFEGIRKELPSVGVCWDFGGATPTTGQLTELAKFNPNAMAGIMYTVLLGEEGDRIISDCDRLGLLIQAHTVNDESVINKLINKGINVILSDYINFTGGMNDE